MHLDHDFTETILQLAPDDEGEVVATLVSSKQNQGGRDAVLYIHGYLDYFFHPHVATAFHEQDMDFYAIDIRKYGRSILSHQTPNYIDDLHIYFEELDLALERMFSDTNQQVYILAHSTGCITACLYANKGKHKDKLSGLILNSPFLDMPMRKPMAAALYRTSRIITRFKPKAAINRKVSGVYGMSLHKDHHGEWDYRLDWKPVSGFSTYMKWAVAVTDAQRWLRKYSRIDVPILSMYSAKSSQPKNFGKKAQTTDTVLWVKHMKKLSPKLGSDVTLLKVKNAKHDVFLSNEAVRQKAFKDMFEWLNEARQAG